MPPVKSIADQREFEQQETTKIRNKAPLAIVKRTEQDFEDWIATEAGFLACFGRYEDVEIAFEPYQKEFLATEAGFRCVEKSRQVGYSWLFACEAIARTHLRTMHNSIFVSYNLADSKEKIAYAQQIHEELPLAYQKKMVTDSKLELGFASNGQSKRVSRIYSHPSRAPRGKKGDIYLDELAHYANDTEVYKGSTALVLRSGGQLTVCSSPLGRRGKFWEIARQEVRPYKTFWRQGVPWWLCSMFCRSPEVHYTAHSLAPKMTTEERVYKLGHQRIIEQFESNTLEDFQQEFEVVYVDESMSFFPYSLILPCTNDELELAEDISQVKALNGGRLVAAFDVGRKRDLSELVIFEESSALSLEGSRKVMRYAQAFDKIKFQIQEEACRQMMNLLPIAKFYIDQNGIGMHLAENLADEFPQVFPYTFSGPSKEVLCNDFKIGLQRHEIILPSDRRLVAQIHSIRKKVTPAGRATFDAQDTEDKGHADRFWACAMACQKEREVKQQPVKVTVRIFAG